MSCKYRAQAFSITAQFSLNLIHLTFIHSSLPLSPSCTSYYTYSDLPTHHDLNLSPFFPLVVPFPPLAFPLSVVISHIHNIYSSIKFLFICLLLSKVSLTLLDLSSNAAVFPEHRVHTFIAPIPLYYSYSFMYLSVTITA